MNKRRITRYIPWLILLGFAYIFFVDCINMIQSDFLSYDSAYNASVAANVARHNFYGVSYPRYLPFYNIITTGQALILPTGMLYKAFGISNLTTSIVPLIYGTISIFMLYFLLNKATDSKYTCYGIVVALFVVFLYLTDPFIQMLSSNLLGEIGCILFLLISFLALLRYLKTEKTINMVVAGAFLSASFLTKTATIFFVVSLFGMLLIETIITKRIKIKGLLMFFIGFLIGIIVLDSYKLFQLGGMERYVRWWQDEWLNMITQSSDNTVSFTMENRINYLSEIFGGYSIWICIFITMLPVVMYTIHILNVLLKKGKCSDGRLVLMMAGVAAASLIVYFVLFGGDGLVYARRHSVNGFFLKVFIAYTVLLLTKNAVESFAQTEKKQFVLYVVAAVLIFTCVFPINKLNAGFKKYISKDNKTYASELMDEYLSEIAAIPEDAQLYCFGWWQEPNITVFLDRDMEDIEENMYAGIKPEDNSYFITGQGVNNFTLGMIERVLGVKMTRVDQSDVDYNRYVTSFDRKDMDYFAIYRIDTE